MLSEIVEDYFNEGNKPDKRLLKQMEKVPQRQKAGKPLSMLKP